MRGHGKYWRQLASRVEEQAQAYVDMDMVIHGVKLKSPGPLKGDESMIFPGWRKVTWYATGCRVLFVQSVTDVGQLWGDRGLRVRVNGSVGPHERLTGIWRWCCHKGKGHHQYRGGKILEILLDNQDRSTLHANRHICKTFHSRLLIICCYYTACLSIVRTILRFQLLQVCNAILNEFYGGIRVTWRSRIR